MIHEDILGTVGGTATIRLDRLGAGLPATLVAKLETLSPGGSLHDRTARACIDALAPRVPKNGTVVAATRGGLGISVAMACAARGLRCVLAMPDTISAERRALARAFGADVRSCPEAVPENDPRSVEATAKRLADEIDGAALLRPADLPGALDVVGKAVADEILETVPDAVAFVGPAADGLALRSIATCLAAAGSTMRVIAAVPRPPSPDEPIAPLHGTQYVSDRDAYRTARRLAREEGVLTSGTGGAVVAAALRVARDADEGAVVVALIAEHGGRALSREHDNDWMRQHGYLTDDTAPSVTAAVLIERKSHAPTDLVTLDAAAAVGDAIRTMQELEVSQIPVVRDGAVVGTLHEEQVIDLLLHAPERRNGPVDEVMEDPLPEVDESAALDEVRAHLVAGNAAVIVRRADGTRSILTKYDLIHGLTQS